VSLECSVCEIIVVWIVGKQLRLALLVLDAEADSTGHGPLSVVTAAESPKPDARLTPYQTLARAAEVPSHVPSAWRPAATRVLLATCTNDGGDLLEWLLTETSAPDVQLVEAFLRLVSKSGCRLVRRQTSTNSTPSPAVSTGPSSALPDAWKR
jgi:hypothetical protein